MQKINFQNLPNTTTSVSAGNLNQLQDNVEDVFDGDVAMGNINTTGVKINNTPIIDSGSNENGNYIKYADGTMICWDRIRVTDQAIDGVYGSLYVGTRVITFPVAFVSQPVGFCSEFQWGTSASWGNVRGINTTTITVKGNDAFPRATGTNVQIGWMAIGKWK